jgi:hypothetical protein
MERPKLPGCLRFVLAWADFFSDRAIFAGSFHVIPREIGTSVRRTGQLLSHHQPAPDIGRRALA